MRTIKVEQMARTCVCRFCGNNIKHKTLAVAWRGTSIRDHWNVFFHTKCWHKMRTSVAKSLTPKKKKKKKITVKEAIRRGTPGWFDGGEV